MAMSLNEQQALAVIERALLAEEPHLGCLTARLDAPRQHVQPDQPFGGSTALMLVTLCLAVVVPAILGSALLAGVAPVVYGAVGIEAVCPLVVVRITRRRRRRSRVHDCTE